MPIEENLRIKLTTKIFGFNNTIEIIVDVSPQKYNLDQTEYFLVLRVVAMILYVKKF